MDDIKENILIVKIIAKKYNEWMIAHQMIF